MNCGQVNEKQIKILTLNLLFCTAFLASDIINLATMLGGYFKYLPTPTTGKAIVVTSEKLHHWKQLSNANCSVYKKIKRWNNTIYC